MKRITVPIDLIRKYAISGPRYTSYPTAVELKPSFGIEQWLAALCHEWNRSPERWEEAQRPISLYFHIPFCQTLCFFCACNKIVTHNTAVVPPYLVALKREIRFYADTLDTTVPVCQLHWGGGSPNYLSPKQMEELFGSITEAFPNLRPDADVSIELDPRTTSKEQLRTLRRLGFNRMSMGVQDFDPQVQRAINRVQPYAMTKELVDECRSLGFESVSIDLVYGLPDQTQAGFSDTLQKVAEINPDRIALYGYAHVTWLTEAQKALEKRHLPTPEERLALLSEAVAFFSGQGYRYIGMDHFARPGDSLAQALDSGALNRNFMGYTTHRGARLLALGASSISMLPGAMAQNTKDVEAYQRVVQEHGCAVDRGLLRSHEDQVRGEVIENLLCLGHVSFAEIERRYDLVFAEAFATELARVEPFLADSLVEKDQQGIRLTMLGRFFMRNVAMIFDQYLPQHRGDAKPMFSQAV